MAEPTTIPNESISTLRLLIDRPKAGKITGVWLSIEDLESMITKCELYRLKSDASYRRNEMQRELTTSSDKSITPDD